MITSLEIAWLAGLIEGEGCILLARSNNRTPALEIGMTDEDVIERVAKLFKRIHYVQTNSDKSKKIAYKTTIYGKDAIQWMFTLYPLLGKRRQAKIKEVVKVWKTTRNRKDSNFFNCGCPKEFSNIYMAGKYPVCKKCVTIKNERNRQLRLNKSKG
jgi:intein/homing endonuclease